MARLRRAALSLAALAIAGCGSAQWREVDERLQALAAEARRAGFAPLAGRNNEFGAFRDSGTTRWQLALVRERPYVLAAACTGGCRGLALEITLSDGTSLARDSSGAGEALLRLVAPVDGAYAVRLAVEGCADGTCRWAAQLYARPRR